MWVNYPPRAFSHLARIQVFAPRAGSGFGCFHVGGESLPNHGSIAQIQMSLL